MSSIDWMSLGGLSISLVWWCTDRHLAISQTTSSQPLMLLLADIVYDLPTIVATKVQQFAGL